MADNNYDPKEVGGIQPIMCPQCGAEIKPLDSYHLSLDNKRYHYPECWQRYELEGPPKPAAPIAIKVKPAPAPMPIMESQDKRKKK